MTYILIVNTLLLVVLTIIFSKRLISTLNLKSILRSGINIMHNQYKETRLRNEVRKYTRAVSIKMSFAEKVELFLIDKSNIRRYVPFFNFYTLLIISLLVFLATFQPIYRVLYFIPSTIVICLVFSLIPTIILDLMGRYNANKIRGQLAVFISVLNRWCKVKEDIFYALEKSIDSIDEPLRTFITDAVIQVQRGINPLDALDMLSVKVDNEQFNDLVINIKQNVKYRGDIITLLSNMQGQASRVTQEYTRRKISTFNDKMLLYIVMFVVLFIEYTFLKINPKVEQFYLATIGGKLLLSFFSLLYVAGFYLTVGISKFDY